MRVAIAGGHGKIARILGRILANRGDVVLGLIRNPDHAADLVVDGVQPVVIDLGHGTPDELAARLAEVDAAVFAAGAGPGSGVARKTTVDRGASVLLADACELASVRRVLQVSAMGTDRPSDPDEVGEVFAAYLDAKRAAEEDLRARDLDWTILRPGRLTDDAPTGRIVVAPSVPRDDITRADVAHVLLALLDMPESARHTLEVVNGPVPIDEALREILS